ncbi:MAG: GNAT family N-acetyltransferase [Halovenus sp.]
MATVRRVPESDFERYRRLIDYGFMPEDGPPGPDREIPDRIADRYGVYDTQGRLVTTGALYELEARLRETWVTLGGLAAVSTPPEHRRGGNARLICTELLEECRDRGIGLTALWPFDHAFYRQFGWALANTYTTYEAPPAQLASAGTTERGRYEEVGPDDWQRLEAVQRAHGEGTTLSRKRSEAWWRRRTFDHGDETPWAYAWLENGDLRGYVVYSFERRAEGGRRLEVSDFSAADRTARRHLLGLLGRHDTQAQVVQLKLAAESSLLETVADPGEVKCSIRAGPMVRICDVPRALEACPYPDHVETQVVFEVRDPLSVVDGQYELTVSDGTSECAPTTGDVDATADVGTLSQLVVGAREVGDLEELDCESDIETRLERVFPTTTVCLREFF